LGYSSCHIKGVAEQETELYRPSSSKRELEGGEYHVSPRLQSRGQKAPAFKRGMNGPLELPALPGLPIRCPSGIIERMDEQTERTSTVQTTVRKTFKY